ncbi:hemerythrin domain-containing protein [Polymorphobacter fuscus]|uniref:Hemerythrin domain-containing protein n=1 Tax=Sandarakinorhabdus fusca TaxID=1439888 RepID=A0A7C9KLU9_9SPHN|nr:hemerythrin domain-containing protein [Polymorphobacter fuscus]KAB7648952.1 hemerythrin domain-containing protein [Polymorphobacter fuscus]MQT16544.1 hemerythrin domain-containing protein [Polymorphobacter fuscus]NJC07165.1 hemerythrin-like domain-containing protein [Polymorphobacter fuscus]
MSYTATQNRTDTAKRHSDSDHGTTTTAVVAGAAGFGLGLLAAAGRKAVVQAATYSAGDWMEGLKAEHKAARLILEKLAETTDDEQAKRAPLVLSLQHAIGKHNVQEEYVVYCVLAETGQDSAADHLNADHFELKKGLYELEQIGKEQRPGFLAKLAEIRASFEEHVREEEDDIFPTLHAALSAEQQTNLTNRMNREGFKVA